MLHHVSFLLDVEGNGQLYNDLRALLSKHGGAEIEHLTSGGLADALRSLVVVRATPDKEGGFPMPPRYTLRGISQATGGTTWEEPVDLAAFVHANHDGLEPKEIDAVMALRPGQTMPFGGGAAALTRLKRIS